MERSGGDPKVEREKAVVIDASVAVKWFNIEEYSDLADKLKEKHIKGEIILAAPVLIVFEVANALRYSPDLGMDDVKNAIDDFLDLQVVLYFPEREWMSNAIEHAYKKGITLYDACYTALAKYLKSFAYTADQRLARKAKDLNLKHISEIE